MLFESLPITSTRKAAQQANVKCAMGLVSGVIAGAAIGAVLGLLLAPQTGEETRKLLKNKSSELAGNVKNKAVKVADTVKAKIDEIKAGKCCCEDECECQEATEEVEA